MQGIRQFFRRHYRAMLLLKRLRMLRDLGVMMQGDGGFRMVQSQG